MKTSDYVDLDFTDIDDRSDLHVPSRREFIKGLGGGLVVLVSVENLLRSRKATAATRFWRRDRMVPPTRFNAYLHIAQDGRITGYTGKIEMGQGPITSLPQMLAEELDAPLDHVELVMGDTARCPWDMGTFGSLTTRMFGPVWQAAAAEARAALLELAAERWKVPKNHLTTKDGAVVDLHRPQRRLTYGELTGGKQIEKHITYKVPLEPPSDYTVIGKPELRRDSRAKVTGAAQYAGDIRLPGMLYAKILRPPAHGAVLESINTAPAKNVPGARIVRSGDLIAVLHPLPDLAEDAAGRVETHYALPHSPLNDETIYAHLLEVAPAGQVIDAAGSVGRGRKRAAHVVDSTYDDCYVAHAAMETHTALAQMKDGKATVWASTQNPFGAQEEVAAALGLPTARVRVIAPFVGGGFGGKTYNQQAIEAARLAKIVGQPVQVMWSREEEFFLDTFQPAAVVKIQSGVSAGGRITAWDYRVYFAGARGAVPFYAIANRRTVSYGRRGEAGVHPFHTGAWRAPGNNTNTFARESQIDQMAAAVGMDPVAFRLKNLKDAKMIRVLKAVAKTFGWTAAKGPSKRGYGVACGVDAGTYVAAMAEVGVNPKTGHVQVKRVACAQEMGLVVNPEGAKLQMEGCITMGLGYALAEEIHFKNGRVLDTNFDSYSLPRFAWVPRIDTVLLDAPNEPPQGGGEPAIVVMGGVIANAIYDATGARMTRMPMTPERVKAAMQKA